MHQILCMWSDAGRNGWRALLWAGDFERLKPVLEGTSKTPRCMAAPAISPESTAVRVIAAMAGITIGGNGDSYRSLAGVAGVTFQPAMGARQRETRLGVMVETPKLPAIRVMASRAAPAQTPLVVLVAMTGRALQRCIAETGRRVTVFAGNRRVQADQGKTRQVVIECDLLSPASLIVTSRTFLPQLALVGIVPAVAGNAAP